MTLRNKIEKCKDLPNMYLEDDVKAAVLEFENWLSQFHNPKEEMELLAESEILTKFREIFGEWH